MKSSAYANLETIETFLPCQTPQAWVDNALANIDIMLIDHAHCEMKAASTAMAYVYKHADKPELITKMSKIAREELVHFEQVMRILKKRNIEFRSLSSARYAGELIRNTRTDKHGRFIDGLILGAFIEARSCERFAKIAPHLDADLQKFYGGLLESEKRHFTIYLNFAQKYSLADITPHVKRISEIEKSLILSPDKEFRFHSGI
ncbi:MAG: tRNA-(ms[2]io[6]A)-hydroxylase [Francisella sp.]|jgi:tRNA-(ms[2]io[6]A)-hydroxylase